MGELDGPQSIHDSFRENLTVSILKIAFVYIWSFPKVAQNVQFKHKSHTKLDRYSRKHQKSWYLNVACDNRRRIRIEGIFLFDMNLQERDCATCTIDTQQFKSLIYGLQKNRIINTTWTTGHITFCITFRDSFPNFVFSIQYLKLIQAKIRPRTSTGRVIFNRLKFS